MKGPPPQLQTQFNEALALHQRGRLQDAQAMYQGILRLSPTHVDAMHLLGLIAHQMGDDERAVQLIDQAVALNPGHAPAYSNRGMALRDLGRPADAVASYDKAIAIQADFVEAHYNRGRALVDLGRLDDALASYDKAIAIAPTLATAHYHRGNVLKALGRLHEAVASYGRAIACGPGDAEPHLQLGDALAKLGQFDAAVASFDRALALNPEQAEAYCSRGNALMALQRPHEAFSDYRRAIAIRPDFAEAYCGRGVVCAELGQAAEALASFDQAIAIKPELAEAHANRAALHKAQGRLDAALAGFNWAITLRPDFPDAHLNRAFLLLLTGDFENGWQANEWRWQHSSLKRYTRDFAQQLWLGSEPLQGKTILLHNEQGLGDAIQFCRYARRVAQLGAKVVLEVPRALAGLMRGLEGVSEVVAEGDALPAFDYHCSLLSLPLAFKSTLATIPASQSYLSVDSGKLADWQHRLGAKTGPRIGLAWSGSSVHPNDRNRSIPLARLLDGLPRQYEFISLQKEVRATDAGALAAAPDLRHFGNDLEDFTDTAALCALMDLIISVDTSVVHLSGALGRETWVLLPYDPDWRWLLGRQDSPWYPSVRLYRQPVPEAWTSVIREVAAELARRFPARP